ncbi:MAG TPA: dipeptide epimerase [Anaerolineales bacterium]|nr:dipeptide epimerase [Anaerolineales bacterium]
MKLTWEPLSLNLKTTFRIAHGASDQRHNVAVSLELGGLRGLGEAAAVPYYGDTQAGIMAYLAGIHQPLGDDPALLEDILEGLPPGSQAARAGVDMALHDLWARQIGQPLYRLLGLNPAKLPQTSFTIPIEEPEVAAARARQSGYPIIKVKLGGDRDVETIAAIRATSSARLRVDANAGWDRQQALETIPRLAAYDLELVEQPLAAGDLAGLRWLHKELQARGISVPIFVDESVKNAGDVAAHAGAVDGVVIKLMKCGGIREALRAIHTSRALGMQVMLSCMVESSLGVTAAAHLAPLCDYADLDGPLLIRDDPFQGIRYTGAAFKLPDGDGLGVKRRPAA